MDFRIIFAFESSPIWQPGHVASGDFRKLWAGHAISDFGSAITTLALPLTAIATLDAGPAQMGLLVAAGQLPVPLLGLFAGVWVDRVRRRPLMIGAEIGRALLLATIPLAAWLGVLSLAQLYAVAFGGGCLTVVFDLGATSYLPSLLARGELLVGNARIQMAHQGAAAGGRTLGGGLVQLVTAPLAIALDAVTFLISALLLLAIRKPEPERPAPAGSSSVWREIAEGLRLTFRQRVIASMTIASTIGSFGGALQQAVLFLFMTHALEQAPLAIGLVMGAASLAAWTGALLAERVATRLGPGPALIGGCFLYALGAALVPLAGPQLLPPLPTLVLAQVAMGFALSLYSVNQISLRQVLTPDALLGRVNASRRVFVFGAIPLGALLGGALGEALGLREALVAGAVASAVCALYALASPLRGVVSVPGEQAFVPPRS